MRRFSYLGGLRTAVTAIALTTLGSWARRRRSRRKPIWRPPNRDRPRPAAGTNVTYTLNALNVGPDDSASVTLSDPIPPGMTFVSASAPGDWSCSTPAVGANGTINCTTALFLAGGDANFSFTFAIPGGTPAGTTFTNITTISSAGTFDPNEENNQGVAVTTVPRRRVVGRRDREERPCGGARHERDLYADGDQCRARCSRQCVTERHAAGYDDVREPDPELGPRDVVQYPGSGSRWDHHLHPRNLRSRRQCELYADGSHTGRYAGRNRVHKHRHHYERDGRPQSPKTIAPSPPRR